MDISEAGCSEPGETLDFIEPAMGIFHLQINVLKLMMIGDYWARAETKDPSFVQNFVKLVRNNRVKRDSKDFRGCLYFMNYMCFTAAGVETFAQFAKAIDANFNWYDILDTLASRTYTLK